MKELIKLKNTLWKFWNIELEAENILLYKLVIHNERYYKRKIISWVAAWHHSIAFFIFINSNHGSKRRRLKFENFWRKNSNIVTKHWKGLRNLTILLNWVLKCYTLVPRDYSRCRVDFTVLLLTRVTVGK